MSKSRWFSIMYHYVLNIQRSFGKVNRMSRYNRYDKIHYDDVIMTMLASQITSLTVVYSIVYSGVNQTKHQSCASLAFVREIHRGPVNIPHKWPVTRKMFAFDDVIMWFAHVKAWHEKIKKCFFIYTCPDRIGYKFEQSPCTRRLLWYGALHQIIFHWNYITRGFASIAQTIWRTCKKIQGSDWKVCIQDHIGSLVVWFCINNFYLGRI